MIDPKTRDNVEPSLDAEGLDVLNSAQKYAQGKDLLYRNGFLIRPDSSGQYAFHRVYTLHSPAVEDDEIQYPDEFKVWRELATDEERSQLMSVVADWASYGEEYEELFKFWVPFIKPNKNKNSPLYMYTSLVLNEVSLAQKRNSGDPVELFQTPNPVVCPSATDRATQKKLAPIKWIPRVEWFPEALRELSIYDILTIYPKVEADLLALIIGRACVGRANHLPPGYEDPIVHTSRMAAFIIGEDPGLGKTTLFTALFNALETVGYRVETFESFASKFNLGAVITADIVYKDDMTDREFKSLTDSGVAKSVISGSGLVKVQDKGVDAYNVMPIATIFANFNNFNPRLTFGIDPGFAERAKCISTVREAELQTLEVSPLSTGSEDYRPFVHLDFLASKLGVSKRTLLLYFCRLCTDRFLQTLETRDGLETQVDFLSQRLRIPFNKDSASQLMSFLICCHLLKWGTDGTIIPKIENATAQISDYNWDTCTHDGLDICRVLKALPHILQTLKEDYEILNPQDYLHPYHGYLHLDKFSLRRWVTDTGAEYAHLGKVDPLAYLVEAFGSLRQANGLPYSKDEVWLVKAYQKIEYYVPEILRLVRRIKAKYPNQVWRLDDV